MDEFVQKYLHLNVKVGTRMTTKVFIFDTLISQKYEITEFVTSDIEYLINKFKV